MNRLKKKIRENAANNKKLHEFKRDYKKFELLQSKNPRFILSWDDRYPILNERTINTHFDTHYIYHPAWAARVLAQTKPDFHVDISSTLNFCTLVSAFLPVKFYDFRPAKINLAGLQAGRADLTHLLFSDESIKSLSCMHVVEHIGLGRYGDELDPDGDKKAIKELKRVVMKNGNLLFVVPVGQQPIIRFNAHRIYTYDQVISLFSEFNLINFALVDDSGSFFVDSDKTMADKQKYGCGCWWFVRK